MTMDNEFMITIRQTVEETENNFIFNTIKPYCESITESRISKRILYRALHYFMTEHNAEYKYLVKESEDNE